MTSVSVDMMTDGELAEAVRWINDLVDGYKLDATGAVLGRQSFRIRIPVTKIGKLTTDMIEEIENDGYLIIG